MNTNNTIEYTSELRYKLKSYSVKSLEELFDLNVSALMSFEGVYADRIANALDVISDELHSRKVAKFH